MTQNNEINFKTFPTTRYQGSKRKILYWIYECIKELNFRQVIDAFGGSASFSYLAKKMGKEVVYNDLMKFNHLIGLSLIENQNVRVNQNEINYVLNNEPKLGFSNFVENNFEGVYFLNDENKWLDRIIHNINNLECSEDTLKFKKAIFFNALFQSSLAKRPFNLFHRKNLYIRTADVKRNFGNKTTWETDFEVHFSNFITQINNSIFDSQQHCKATNESVFNLDFPDADCIYLDPPYYSFKNSNETSNYFKCYHFLEGIADYSNWSSLIDHNSGHKGFKSAEMIDHITKKNIEISFEMMFEKYADKTIILSYKSGGKPSIEWLENKLLKMGKKVKTNLIDYSYALNRDSKKGTKTVEALIVAK